MPDEYPPGLREAMLLRYEDEGGKKLAADFACPVSTVYELAKKLGIKSKSRWKNIATSKTIAAENRKTDEQRALDSAILARYAEEGVKKIAVEFGVSEDKVAMRAYKLGVKSLNHRKHLVESFVANTDNCNSTAFDLPLTAEAAYFLGLLWADGSIRWQPPVHTVNLTLSETEWHLLEAFQKFMGVDGHIHNVKVRKGKEGHKRQKSVNIGNKRLVEQIVALGVKQNKSNLDLPNPDCISDDIFHHWARGWLDGDGSISYGGVQDLPTPRIMWYGTETAVRYLAKKVADLACARPKEPYLSNKRLTDKCWGVGWSNWMDVRKILLWLHQDGGTYAFRKHDRPMAQARAID